MVEALVAILVLMLQACVWCGNMIVAVLEIFYAVRWGEYFDAKYGILFYALILMYMYTQWCGRIRKYAVLSLLCSIRVYCRSTP